jgi:hypothetical protein
MPPSGVYPRTIYNTKQPIKLGFYKIFGLFQKDSIYPFYYGVSRNYLCQIKSYIVYRSRKHDLPNNELFNKVREIQFLFDIRQLETLPKDFTFDQAKKHLQKNYIDREIPTLTNSNNFIENPYKPIKPNLTKEVKSVITDAYKSGVKVKTISEEMNIPESRIRYTIRVAGVNSKRKFNKIKEEYTNGRSLESIVEEYGLSRYKINKLINS